MNMRRWYSVLIGRPPAWHVRVGKMKDVWMCPMVVVGCAPLELGGGVRVQLVPQVGANFLLFCTSIGCYEAI